MVTAADSSGAPEHVLAGLSKPGGSIGEAVSGKHWVNGAGGRLECT